MLLTPCTCASVHLPQCVSRCHAHRCAITFHLQDVSKLAQWEVVMDHAERLGIFIHIKMQETENDEQVPPLRCRAASNNTRLWPHTVGPCCSTRPSFPLTNANHF